MAFAPYKQSEIEHYAEDHLKIIGDYTEQKRRKHRQDFAQAIGTIPAWQQTLLMHCDGSNIACDDNAILEIESDYTKDKGDLYGFFCPGEIKVGVRAKEQFNAVNAIFWTLDTDVDVSHIIYHEQGHRMGWLLGQRNPAQQYECLSFIPEWRNVIMKEFVSRMSEEEREEYNFYSEEKSRLHLATLPKESISEEEMLMYDLYSNKEHPVVRGPLLRTDDSDRLYKGYRTFREIINNSINFWSVYAETFAEMNAHYCVLYGETGGSDKAVDRTLQRHYPYAWPVFRDIICERGKELAADMVRHKNAPTP